MADGNTIGTVEVVIGADNSDLLKKLDQIDKKMDGSAKNTLSNLDKMKLGFVGLGVSVAAFGGYAVREAYKYGNAIMDMRDKTGMASEEVSKLFALGAKAGMSNEGLDAIFTKFSRSAYNSAKEMESARQAGEKATNAYAQLGVQLVDTEGKMRSSLDIFMDLTDEFKKMPDGVHKTALEMEVFGRSGTQVHDMLHLTREEMEATIKTAEDLGLILSNDQAEAWKKVQIAGNDAKMAMQGLTTQIGTALLPTITKLTGNVQDVTKWFSNLSEEEKKNIALCIEYAAKLLGVAGGLRVVAAALKMVGLSAGAALGPIGLLVTALWLAADAWGAYYAAQDNKIGVKVDSYDKGAEVFKKADGSLVKKTIVETPNGQVGRDGKFEPFHNARGEVINKRSVVEAPLSEAELAQQNAYEKNKNRPALDELNSLNISDAVSGGGGSEDTETALQKYKEAMSEIIRESELLTDAGVKTRAEHAETIKQQIEGLKGVGVGTDEVRDKNITLLEAQKQLNDVVKQGWEENVKLANEANSLASQSVQLAGLDEEAKKKALSGQLELLQKNFELLKNTAVLEKDKATKQQELNSNLIEQRRIYTELNADAIDNFKFEIQLIEKKVGNTKKFLQLMGTEKLALEEKIQLLKDQIALETDPATLAALQQQLDLRIAQNVELGNAIKSTMRSAALDGVQSMTLISDAWQSSMADIVKGTKNGADIMNDIFDDLLNKLMQMVLFGDDKNGGGLLSGLLGSLFSGGGTKINSSGGVGSVPYGPTQGRSRGGHMKADEPVYWQEEGRKELFIPNVDGYAMSGRDTADMMRSLALSGGGGAPNVTFNLINQSSQEMTAEHDVQFDGEAFVMNVVLKNIKNDPNVREQLKGAVAQ